MQLDVIARADRNAMRQWVEALNAQWLPYEYAPGKFGKFRLSVREIRLFQLTFPEPVKDYVLSLVYPEPWRKSMLQDMGILALQKALRADIDIDLTGITPAGNFAHNHIECIGIGMKKDERDSRGIEKL